MTAVMLVVSPARSSSLRVGGAGPLCSTGSLASGASAHSNKCSTRFRTCPSSSSLIDSRLTFTRCGRVCVGCGGWATRRAAGGQLSTHARRRTAAGARGTFGRPKRSLTHKGERLNHRCTMISFLPASLLPSLLSTCTDSKFLCRPLVSCSSRAGSQRRRRQHQRHISSTISTNNKERREGRRDTVEKITVPRSKRSYEQTVRHGRAGLAWRGLACLAALLLTAGCSLG